MTYQGTRWWMIPIAGIDWLLYLVIMHAINPGYYGGQFPYIYYVILPIIAISIGVAFVLFIVVNLLFDNFQESTVKRADKARETSDLKLKSVDLRNPPKDAIFLPKAIINKEILPYLQNIIIDQPNPAQSRIGSILNGATILQLHEKFFIIKGPLGELFNIARKENLPILLTLDSYFRIKNSPQGPAFLRFLSLSLTLEVLELARSKELKPKNEFIFAQEMGWRIPEIKIDQSSKPAPNITMPKIFQEQDDNEKETINSPEYNDLFNVQIDVLKDQLANKIYTYYKDQLPAESQTDEELSYNQLIPKLVNVHSEELPKIKIEFIPNFYSTMLFTAAKAWFHDQVETYLDPKYKKAPPTDLLRVVFCEQKIDSIKKIGKSGTTLLFPILPDIIIDDQKSSFIQEYKLILHEIKQGSKDATIWESESDKNPLGYSLYFDLDWNANERDKELEKELIATFDKDVITEYAGVYLGLFIMG
jgi:hypothetical protein